MSKSKSKKRNRVTCVDYKKIVRKQTKPSNNRATSNSLSVVPYNESNRSKSSITSPTTSSFLYNLLKSAPVPPSSSYIKTPCSKGIDLATFRLRFIQTCIPYQNLCNTIARSVASNFECYPKSNTIDSIVSNSNSAPIELLNKNRCLIEDYMQLPSGSEVALLVPLFSTKVNHILKNLNIISDKHNVQFGTDRSKKYLLFSGYIQ